MHPLGCSQNLGVKGFKELKISPLQAKPNRGTSVTLTCIVGAVHNGLGVRICLQINGHTLWGLNRAKHSSLFVSLICIVGNPLIGVPIIMDLFFGGMDHKVRVC